MSQEKVQRYKEEKANRKAIMRKQKIARIVRNSVAGVVVVAVLGWVGYSGVVTYLENIPREEVTMDYAAISDYEVALESDETSEAETSEAETSETETETE